MGVGEHCSLIKCTSKQHNPESGSWTHRGSTPTFAQIEVKKSIIVHIH